jgi:hypothetical protein
MLASGRRYQPQVRAHPLFAQANRRITWAWTAYFAAAAVVAAVIGPWASLALAAPTPLLGWLSYRYGDRYATSRLAQAQSAAPPTASPTNREAAMSTSQEDLRALIEGKSDDELLAAVGEAAPSFQAFIDQTMAGMVEALDPAAAEDCVIGYEITTPDGMYAYRVEVRDGAVTTEERDPTDARVVLGLSLPDYLRLINGLLDGTQAFMSGRLKLRGDVMFAPQIERIFRRG